MASSDEPSETLTSRQREILALIATGHSTSRIAHKLGISPLTARKHRANMLQRLSLGSASALTAYAVRNIQPYSVSEEVGRNLALSCREREIVILILGGKTSKEIAIELRISFYTVRKHRENIYQKLEVSSTAELLVSIKKKVS